MVKILRYIAIIVVCCTILFFGYHRYSQKQAEKKFVDLTKTTIVTQLEALNRLETAAMTMQKTVKGQQEFKDLVPNTNRDNVIQNFLFEDSLEMIVTARVTAGFDLSTISSWSITVNEDNTVSLTLPKPQVLQYMLKPDTKPFLRKRGVLTAGDIQLETEIRNQTLEKMKQEAIDKGLLQNAQENATMAFKSILSAFGVQLKEIIVK